MPAKPVALAFVCPQQVPSIEHQCLPSLTHHPLLVRSCINVQYFGGMGASSKSHSHSPDSKASSASGDECEGSDALSSAGSGGSMEVSDAAHQIAHAMCAAQQLPGDPPQPVSSRGCAVCKFLVLLVALIKLLSVQSVLWLLLSVLSC
jgi:hypothetical protein